MGAHHPSEAGGRRARVRRHRPERQARRPRDAARAAPRSPASAPEASCTSACATQPASTSSGPASADRRIHESWNARTAATIVVVAVRVVPILDRRAPFPRGACRTRHAQAARLDPHLAAPCRTDVTRAYLIAGLVTLLAIAPHRSARSGLDVIRGQVTNPELQPIENANVTATSVSGGVNRTRAHRPRRPLHHHLPRRRRGLLRLVHRHRLRTAPFRGATHGRSGDPRRRRAAPAHDAAGHGARRRLARAREPERHRARPQRHRAVDPERRSLRRPSRAISTRWRRRSPASRRSSTPTAIRPASRCSGFGADQNNTTLNGANFGASNVPRDARVSTRSSPRRTT